MNKPKILAKLLLFVMLWACSTEIKQQENPPLKSKKQTKNIHFRGLEVKHRFLMPAEYLDDKTQTKFTNQVAKKLYTLSDYRLEDIAEITKETFKKFPNPSEDKDFKLDYKMIIRDFPKLTLQQIKKNDSLIAIYYAINLDYEVLEILKKTKKPVAKKDNNLKQLESSYGYYGYGNLPPSNIPCSMINFPTDRNKFLMNYYLPCQTQNSQGNINVVTVMGGSSQSIPCKCVEEEYQKLQPIWADQRRSRRKNEMNNCNNPKINILSNIKNKIASLRLFIRYVTATKQLNAINVVGIAVVSYALDESRKAQNINPMIDAVRHMYWQMLLCKNFYHVFRAGSKKVRMDFAQQVGDLYEIWKVNHIDDTVMDLHNNEVGRNIWAKDTNSWDVGWWIFKSIHTVADHKLLEVARDAYKKVQIVHDELTKKPKTNLGNTYDYDAIKPTDSNFDSKLNICNRRYWILNEAAPDRPVETYKNQR